MKKTTHSSNSNPDKLTEDEITVQNVLNKHLDAQVENLDFNISSKLSAARHQALAGQSRLGGKSFGIGGLQWPGLVAASCAVVLVAFLAVQLNSEAPEADSSQLANYEPALFIEDLNILSAADDIDFYQSVEFLEWMENNAG
ncbi:DUF3619 family protein [Granulosicoccus sp.]|nr:hypothetical protein [Granulosicoccus sp.]MDB4223256.1 DUF3619 family protein [Granulosicoccus sp.]